MSYIQSSGFAQKAVALAIALLALNATAQETPQEIAGPEDPIVVTATRTPTRYNLLIPDVSVVDRETMQQYGPQAQISDALVNEPGITVNNSGTMGTTTTIQIRGASNNQSILLVDGLRLNSTANGGPAWAYIPMQQVGRMEIVRGPTSASYGSDAIGGVIQLFTRKGEGPTKFYLDAGYGTYGTSSETIGVEGSQNDFSYSVYGGNTHSLGLPTYTNASTDFNPNSASYVNSSASTRLAYTLAPGQEIGVTALYGNGYNSFTTYNPNTYNNNEMGYQTQLLQVLSAYTQNKILKDWQSLVRVGQTVDNQKNYLAAGTPNNSYRTTQNQIQWQNDLTLPLGKGLLVYEYLQQKLGSNIVNQWDTSTSSYSNVSRTVNSVQAGWNGDVGNNLFQANIRNDNSSQYGNATTGSVGYGYFIVPSIRGTAAWGTGFRAPSFNELYWQDTSYYYQGNPNLAPERSQNSEIALRFDSGGHQAGIVYYYNKVNHLISSVLVDPVNYIYSPENINNATLQGYTLNYGGKVFGLKITGSYDYQDARNSDTGKLLPYRPANFGSLTIDKKHERWDFGGQMQMTGSQQTDPASTKNITLGGYTLFNIFGSLNLRKDFSLFLRGNNIFNKQYSNNANPAYPSGANYFRNPGSNFFVGLRFDTR